MSEACVILNNKPIIYLETKIFQSINLLIEQLKLIGSKLMLKNKQKTIKQKFVSDLNFENLS